MQFFPNEHKRRLPDFPDVIFILTIVNSVMNFVLLYLVFRLAGVL